jgi:hypothetical protein
MTHTCDFAHLTNNFDFPILQACAPALDREYLWLLAHVTAVEPGENETSIGVVDQANPPSQRAELPPMKRSRTTLARRLLLIFLP